MEECGADAYHNKEKLVKNRFIAMYHRDIGEVTKKHVISQFTREETNMRVVVATIAFGRVVHWGILKNSLPYWQEVGRAGLYFKKVDSKTSPIVTNIAKSRTFFMQ